LRHCNDKNNRYQSHSTFYSARPIKTKNPAQEAGLKQDEKGRAFLSTPAAHDAAVHMNKV